MKTEDRTDDDKEMYGKRKKEIERQNTKWEKKRETTQYVRADGMLGLISHKFGKLRQAFLCVHRYYKSHAN